MKKAVVFLITLATFNISIYAQNWTNLEYNPDQPGLELNPLKGFMTLWNPSTNFPRSIEGKNFGLDEVMSGMDSFNWTVIDDFISNSAAKGNFSSIQVIIDPANGNTHMPEFLIDQVDWKVKPSSLCPDWNNEILMQAMLNFITAFGERYNNDSRVFLVTLGLYGMWGEWHVGADKTYKMTQENLTRLSNTYKQAFPDKNLMARYANLVPEPQLFGYSDGLFFSASIDSNIENRWAFHNMLKINHADQNWKQHPIGGEIDPALQAEIFDNWPNTVGQDVTQCLDSIRPTFLICHYLFQNATPSTEEWDNAIRVQKMLGYTFFVNQYRLTAANGKATIEINIQNKGLAPMYANWEVEMAVLDSDHQFQSLGKTKWNLQNILPDEDQYRTLTASTAIADGTYTVLLRIVNPLNENLSTEKQKPVRFANATQDAHKTGWLTLGEMTLSNGVCGETPISVSGISVSSDSITLTQGDTFRLNAIVSPSNASRKDITWTSDLPAIADVDSTGLVTTGPEVGQAIISAITQDGFYEARTKIIVDPIRYNIPGRVEAEDFFKQSGVQTENCSDVGGGLNVGYIDDGDWMKYSIINETDSINFGVIFRYASTNDNNGIINVFLDDMEVGKVICPKTGGWQSWESDTIALKIDHGKHYLDLVAESGKININYIDFIFATDTNDPIITGLNQFQKNNIQIYPMPASEYIRVNTGAWLFNKIDIIDLTGKIIYSKQINSQSAFELPLNVSSGIYILKLGNPDYTISKKLIINK